MIVTRVGEDFYIASEQAKRLFTTNDLASVTLDVTRNCCSGEAIQTDFEFEFPDLNCIYKADFCTFNSNTGICIKPDGVDADTCYDMFYTTFRRLYVSINGETVSAVKGEYDITDPLVVGELNEEINQFFKDEGYSGVTATMTVTTANGDVDYCISISIEGLPNGVVPESFVIGNETPCFALPLFECVFEGRGDCVEQTASLSLDRFRDIKGTKVYPTFYNFVTITVDNNGVEQELQLGNDFIYYVPTPTSVDFTGVNNYFKAVYNNAGFDADFDVSIDINHNLIIKVSNYTAEPKYITLFYPPPIESFGVDNFTCSAYEDPLPTCDWKTEIIRGLDDSDIKTISTLFIQDDNLAAPISILSKPYDLFVPRQRSEFVDEVNGWFTNNGYTGEIEVTVTADKITLEINNISEGLTPYSALLASGDGNIYEFLFYCGNITNIPDTVTYNPLVLEYRPDYIIVKPGYFGTTELKDGIYNFVLTIVGKDGTIYTEHFCYFVDDETKCNIIKALVKDPNSRVHHYYEAILHASDCNDCDCAKACELYRYLLTNLNTILNGKQQMCRCYNC